MGREVAAVIVTRPHDVLAEQQLEALETQPPQRGNHAVSIDAQREQAAEALTRVRPQVANIPVIGIVPIVQHPRNIDEQNFVQVAVVIGTSTS